MSPDTAEGKAEITERAGLAERQAEPQKFDMPRWGKPITPAEVITMILQREGSRSDAIVLLSQTLADLGISGEEIAHYQKEPGTCHDCNETSERNDEIWSEGLKNFSHAPIEMYRGYWKNGKPL